MTRPSTSVDWSAILGRCPRWGETQEKSIEAAVGVLNAEYDGINGEGVDVFGLEEPTEGMAVQIVEDVRDLIEEIREMGVPTLLVEQNVEVAVQTADGGTFSTRERSFSTTR